MANGQESLMVEILRRLQADMAELKEGQRTANVHLAAIRLELSDAPNP